MMKKSIAVIGGGPSGLTAIKACREEDLDVICFEKTGEIGGLWRYHDGDEYGKPSVMKSTIINSHKEMSAFTDFPPPAEFPSYMHHTQLLKYIEMYADRFKLRPYVRFHQEVLSVSRADDYDQTGRWIVKSKSLENNAISEEIYDGVMICTGHHACRSIPNFPDQDKFGGKITHSHSYKCAKGFDNLNVLVVGSGNSGMDVAVEISDVAKKVYVSTRKGVWVVSRRGPFGLPFDASFSTRLTYALVDLIGWNLASKLFEIIVVDNGFNHKLYGLKPKHRFLSQHPTTNDYIASKILAGRVTVKPDIKTFAKDGVIFENESSVTPIDAVVFSTGYSINFPFIKEHFANVKDNKIELYKNVFPPHLKHPSLAMIGLCQPNGSIFPVSDSQSQWFALLMNGKVKFPSIQKMVEQISLSRKASKKRFLQSPRHTIQVDFVPYMDSINTEIGAKPNLLKMLLTNPILFWMCVIGPCLPYQYRLEGPHAWKGAKEAILKYPQRVSKPLSSGVSRPFYSHFEVLRVALPLLLFLISIILNMYLILLVFS